MAKKKETNDEKLEQLTHALEKSFQEWENINQNGCNDPSWPDGSNMNLVRNHIFNYKNQIKELCDESKLPIPEIFNRPEPLEVDNNYYAKRDEILKNMQEIIEKAEHTYNLDEYEQDSLLVKRFSGFKRSVDTGELSHVRFRTFDEIKEYAKKSKKRLHKFEETNNGQLGLIKDKNTHTIQKDIVIDQRSRLQPLFEGFLKKAQLDWMGLLDVAATTHKHSFSSQVMIFGQDKNASMIADEKTWNKIGRYIKFAAEYIIAIEEHNYMLVENRLYDVNQTYGDDIPVNVDRFILNESEMSKLNSVIEDKYKIKSYKLTDSVKLLTAGLFQVTPIADSEKQFEKLIKNSVYYIVCKKLGILSLSIQADKFDEIADVPADRLAYIGNYINKASQKLLGNIEKQINEIRGVLNGRENHYNQQQEVQGFGQRLPAELGKRDSLQEGLQPSKQNSDIGADDRSRAVTGQLSFGALRQSVNEIHEGKSQQSFGRADDGRKPYATIAREGGAVENSQVVIDGGNGEEKPTSENSRFQGDNTAYEYDTRASRGAGEGGAVSGDLTAYNEVHYGSPKEKFRANVEAVQLLKKIESENRLATADECNILSKYLGWGGLSKVFDEQAKDWQQEYSELKELLSDEEYELARASTTTAFYTPTEIIEVIYDGLSRLGLKDGDRILDPAMGTGNFFKALPPSLSGCELHGVELDNITGRIAKLLHPNANIQIRGYQDTQYQDNLFPFAVGNVPFGDFKIYDERYNKEKFLIHDYFFAKTIDTLQPKGVMAFITSSGTMDKKNSSFRRYMASRAELIGAVRLPSTTFKKIAGTEAVSDILFFRKRDQQIISEPEWLHLNYNDEGIPLNQYFVDNPHHMLGKPMWRSSQFGQIVTLKADESFDLIVSLKTAISDIVSHAESIRIENVPISVDEIKEELPATPDTKNFTYTVINEQLYYRENDVLLLQHLPTRIESKIRGMHDIRAALRSIIKLQEKEYNQNIFDNKLEYLNSVYDRFVKQHGFLSDKSNKRAFIEDSDLPLLLSIEDKDKDGKIKKAKVFYEPTIRPAQKFTPTTYEDLITLTMSNKGYIDIPYMAEEFKVKPIDVILNLKGKIYLNPDKVNSNLHKDITEFRRLMLEQDIAVDDKKLWEYIAEQTLDKQCFEQADAYLTGHVKSKLDTAEVYAQRLPEIYDGNAIALKAVQPEPLTIDQIEYKLGSSWIDLNYIKEFMNELVNVPKYMRQLGDEENGYAICLTYNKHTGVYTVHNKGVLKNVQTTSVYGTERRSFFTIIEDCLNLKESRVFDIVPYITPSGKEATKQVLNVKETQLARQKQELIKYEFKNFITADAQRMADVVKTYNNIFNVYRLRQYDGYKLIYEGMSDEIKLREHQNNSVARCLYSGQNVLLGHVVGAGKTYTMVAAAMKLKQLGIARKPLIVVPNHLTEQWGEDWLKLYPAASILVATKKDFEPENRKRFVGKICTGDYDAIIIGHTQFEKIPMSPEFVQDELKQQISDITNAIEELNRDRGTKRFTVKQMEKQKENLKTQLKKLSSDKRKDNLLTMEQTGIDYVFVDEAHYYKNCYVNTKLSNVAGISTTAAQKSFDMLIKCKYITQKNNGRGVVFATGTPISNSMVEAFVLQRYLQPNALESAHIDYFDNWASNFGETKMVLELKPEGTGFRMRTRFSKFHNVPELMAMFGQVADIKVAEDLKLPVPTMQSGKPIIVVAKPSEYVKEYVSRLAERAEAIRNGAVDPKDDNMLKITNEGRAVAIDPRLVNTSAPIDEGSKIYQCCENVKKIYDEGSPVKAAQLIFLDTGIWIYDIIKEELTAKGILENEIAFIGDAKTEEQKAKLFANVRSGKVRVLLGSTQKMGAGTNVQERLLAVHHIDCPWRPADIEQREGRIIRQGNIFDEVYVYRYVTENTFDAYLWQIQENKQKFITQIMTNKSVARSCDDIDDAVLDCAEVKTLATGDPRIKEKMQLDNDVAMLQNEKAAFLKQKSKLQDIILQAPQRILSVENMISQLSADVAVIKENSTNEFKIKVGDVVFDERPKAGEALTKTINAAPPSSVTVLGEYCGLTIQTEKERDFEGVIISLKGSYEKKLSAGQSSLGLITRIENAAASYTTMLLKAKEDLTSLQKDIEAAKAEVLKPFAKEAEFHEKLQKQVTLNSELEIGGGDNQVVEDEGEGINLAVSDKLEKVDVALQSPPDNNISTVMDNSGTSMSLSEKLKLGKEQADLLNSLKQNRGTNSSLER